MCKGIEERIQKIKNNKSDISASIEDGKTEVEIKNNKSIKYTYYITNINQGTLIVVQAFVNTLKWPTYISIGAVGHIAAEGVIIDKSGKTQEAPDTNLWAYR